MRFSIVSILAELCRIAEIKKLLDGLVAFLFLKKYSTKDKSIYFYFLIYEDSLRLLRQLLHLLLLPL